MQKRHRVCNCKCKWAADGTTVGLFRQSSKKATGYFESRNQILQFYDSIIDMRALGLTVLLLPGK